MLMINNNKKLIKILNIINILININKIRVNTYFNKVFL